ncbi:MAG TPA: hypothetical protein VGS79_13185 [Puia sp.]|nr:hypothetical protein [Puia sp.]
MPLKRKQPKKSAIAKTSAILSDQVASYENHPFFVKKAERAKAFIEAHGLPKDLEKKHK